MSNSSPAFVLLENPATPNLLAVAEALRARHPELPVEVVAPASPTGARQDAASSPLIRFGDELCVVMSMPAPIPEDAGLWSRAATTWREGKMVAARHRGHLIVSVLGNRQQPLHVARVTTAVIGALVAAIPECC